MIYWTDEQILSAVDAGPSVSAPPVAARLPLRRTISRGSSSMWSRNWT